MIRFVSFATDNMSRSLSLAWASAVKFGAESARPWTEVHLRNTDFFKCNRSLFDYPRGFGFWSWKPFIIGAELRASAPGDVVVYADAGVEVIENLRYIIDRMDQDLFLFANLFPHAHWCKRDVIDTIMPEAPWEAFGNQVQASVIFVRATEEAKAFVQEWEELCMRHHLVTDQPSRHANHPEFQEHRHDQAILTTLAYRDGFRLHWWPSVYNRIGGGQEIVYSQQGYPNDSYPPLFHHHRLRNSEWEALSK